MSRDCGMEGGQWQPAGPATHSAQEEGAQCYCGSFQLADWLEGVGTQSGDPSRELGSRACHDGSWLGQHRHAAVWAPDAA